MVDAAHPTRVMALALASNCRETRNLGVDQRNYPFTFLRRQSKRGENLMNQAPCVQTMMRNQNTQDAVGTSDLRQAQGMQDRQQPEDFVPGYRPSDFEPAEFDESGLVISFERTAASAARMQKTQEKKLREQQQAAQRKQINKRKIQQLTEENTELLEKIEQMEGRIRQLCADRKRYKNSRDEQKQLAEMFRQRLKKNGFDSDSSDEDTDEDTDEWNPHKVTTRD